MGHTDATTKTANNKICSCVTVAEFLYFCKEYNLFSVR